MFLVYLGRSDANQSFKFLSPIAWVDSPVEVASVSKRDWDIPNLPRSHDRGPIVLQSGRESCIRGPIDAY